MAVDAERILQRIAYIKEQLGDIKKLREAFRVLCQHKIITEEEYATFSAMVGFRNRMVHLYQLVSDERVYDFSTSELQAFEVFISKISASLDEG